MVKNRLTTRLKTLKVQRPGLSSRLPRIFARRWDITASAPQERTTGLYELLRSVSFGVCTRWREGCRIDSADRLTSTMLRLRYRLATQESHGRSGLRGSRGRSTINSTARPAYRDRVMNADISLGRSLESCEH